MDFTRPVNATDAPLQKEGGWGRRLLLAVGAVFLLLVAVVALAPAVLSMAWARAFVVARVNAALAPARVEVRDWSLAWFGEQCVEGIVYDDVSRGVRARVRALRVGSLWALLPLGKMTAEVTVEVPEVTLSAGAKGASAPVAPVSASPETATRAPFVLPAWDISAKLSITEATVRMASLPEPLLMKGRAEVSLPALSRDIEVIFSGIVLGGAANAEIILPSAQTLLAATRPADFVRQAQANLCAPWATLEAQVRQAREGEAWPTCGLTVRLDVAQAVAHAQTFWGTLPGLTAASGTIDATATLAPATEAPVRVSMDMIAREAMATYEGRRIALGANVSAGMAMVADPACPLAAKVERLSVSLPGFLASGKGTLEGGSLSAQLETDDLLAAFAPFVGGFRLPRPLSVRLDARATKEGGFGLTAKARSGEAVLGDVTLKAEGLDLAAQRIRSVKLGVKGDLGVATRFAPLPEGQRLEGTFYLNAAAAGALTDFKGSLALALRDVAYRAASWKVGEPSLLEGEASFEGKSRESAGGYLDWLLAVPTFKLSTPVATLEGAASYVPRGAMTVSAKGVARPGDALSKWRVWGKNETPVTLAGKFAYAVTGQLDGQRKGKASVEAESETFSVTLPPYRAIALPFTFKAETTLGPAVTLESFNLASPYLAISAKGMLEGGRACVEGEWTPNLGRAFEELPFFEGLRKHVSVSGNATRPFSFEAPIDQGGVGILNYGKGNAEVAIDRVVVPGLDIPGGTVRATLAEGVAALDGQLAVNGGTVRLSPRVALAVQPYTLIIPDGTKVLEGVAFTQELMDTVFKVINPLLSGSATPRGTLDLVCDTFTLPLVGDPLRELEAKLTLLTHDFGITPNGLLGSLLRMLHVEDKAAYLPDQTFGVRVAEGKLTCDPIRMRVAAVKLECTGSTDLVTRELDYTLSLPLTRQLLGDRLAKRLKVGETLRLPISGTFDKPVLDTAPVIGALADSALGRATDRLSERLGETLKKGGEAGGAVGDALRSTGETGADVGERVGDVLRSFFDRKRKKK